MDRFSRRGLMRITCRHSGVSAHVRSRAVAGVVAFLALIGAAMPAATGADDEKKPARTGSVTGTVTDRGKNYIEVKADGEEKPRRYVPHFPGRPEGTDKATLELLPKIPVDTRVKLDWLFEERPRVMKIEVLKKADEAGGALLQKVRTGTTIGELKSVSPAKNKRDLEVEVLAPGDEKARRYTVGAQQKDVLVAVKAAAVGDRVEIGWFDTVEGLCVEKFLVLKKGAKGKDK